MNRRGVLRWVVRGIGAATAAVLAVPAVATLFSPVWRYRRAPLWQPVGGLDDFPVQAVEKAVVSVPPEEARPRTLAAKGVFVWRPDEQEVVVFSRNCTDLSCPVTWDPGSGWFFCPCHGGIFNEQGEPMAGPPPVPLYRYDARVQNGVLEIDLHSVPPMS